MSPRYAERTEVGADKSKAEIEKALTRWGADSFVYGWERDLVRVGFRMRGRHVLLRLPLPDRGEFALTPSGKWERTEREQRTAYDRAIRQCWRALLLIIKAKLEAIDAGVATFEDEWLPHTLLPSGETVADWLQPQVEEAYRSGEMPALLPGHPTRPMLPNGRAEADRG
jgi:hypothetical protein